MEIYYINRSNGEKEKENVPGGKQLQWLYGNKLGNFFLEFLVKRKFLSSLYGKLQDLPTSKSKIKTFSDDFNIDLTEAIKEKANDYKSFNDFFSRSLKSTSRPIDFSKNSFISPADGKVLAYENIDENSVFQVKGSKFSLDELLLDKNLSKEFNNGVFIVIRLAPPDYHRYHFFDNCKVLSSRKISGNYYSVNPISLFKKPKVYCKNKRTMSLLDTENFGKSVFIEVGATFVGTIVSNYKTDSNYKKGSEMGYFKFGGSTVILLFKENMLKIDEDIILNSKNGLETKINMGEKLGSKY